MEALIPLRDGREMARLPMPKFERSKVVTLGTLAGRGCSVVILVGLIEIHLKKHELATEARNNTEFSKERFLGSSFIFPCSSVLPWLMDVLLKWF